jgi:sensor domain CHASE-containing protein
MRRDTFSPMTEPDPEPPTLEDLQRNTTALEKSLAFSDRVALGAVITAAIALVVGVIQTWFMWNARNDAVTAELRAQQLRSCVRYRTVAQDYNREIQIIAFEGRSDERDKTFGELHEAYQVAIVELSYLLPKTSHPALDRVQDGVSEVIVAMADENMDTLAGAAGAGSTWSTAHNGVLEACERVIRTVRDK